MLLSKAVAKITIPIILFFFFSTKNFEDECEESFILEWKFSSIPKIASS